jgi:hypothetical protein
MESARVFVSLAWFLGGVVATEVGNDYFIQLAFRFGPVVSMGVALLSGLAWASIGYRLVSPRHQKGAVVLSLAVLVPLLGLKGYGGISEMQRALLDPDYYETRGVGPVDQIALLAQAGGVLMGGLIHWRSLHRANKLPAELFSEET